MMVPESTYKVGDIVERLVSVPGKSARREWRRVVVEKVYPPGVLVDRDHIHLLTRRIGRTSDGRRYGVFLCRADHVRLTADRVAANMSADWLEENGFPEAAAALRAAFPLVESEAECTRGG